jgi:hypothetical protein
LQYRKSIDEWLEKTEQSTQVSQEILRDKMEEHLNQIGFFQHERLIHLIVTAELFLSLQQRKYRRLGISVVCACISDNGEMVRSLQNKMEEELEEENVWRPFREEILQEKWMDIIRQQKQDDSYAGILCVGSRVLFFSHGRMRICGCFQRFGRTQWRTMQESCMAGEVEPGTAMLMADNGFLNFCEEELTACLQPQIAGRPDARERMEGAARRLKELGEKAERHGGTHMGAVWILPVMGGKGWSRE